ncbi:MAG: hypothetical protein KF760_15920 [Candidatus Eremiobacteraeota bacterium]|nr:hypothetical protein [Candidatus Eremiobacteraeota bacterium]MCW5867392.1 hypothetical protein [Candidatus Eremiobacteraeota bacterium]
MSEQANVTAKCWKVHTCAHCQTLFRYLMERFCTATGETQEQARLNLRSAVSRQTEEGVDSHPCPTCGLVQPEMVKASRTFHYGCLSFLIGATGLGVYLYHGFSSVFMGSIWNGILLSLLFLFALLTYLGNPNRDLESNRGRAQSEIQRQVLVVEQAPETVPSKTDRLARLTKGGPPLAVFLMLAGLALVWLPQGVRVSKGLDENPGLRFFPRVVGPGDELVYRMQDSTMSLNGLWKARSLQAQLDGKQIPAVALDGQWGNEISTFSSKSLGLTEKHTMMKIRVSIPNDASLVGKEATLELKLDYVVPSKFSNYFKEQDRKATEKVKVRISSPGAASLYSLLGWLALIGGPVLLFTGCLIGYLQANRLEGNPHRTLPAED